MDESVAASVLTELRSIVSSLPEAHEEAAWTGTRWRIRTATFAHVLVLVDGRPASYAAASGLRGPATVLTFQSSGDELAALSAMGPPFFRPTWRPGIVWVVLDGRVGWDELRELVTESYRLLAPRKLVRLLDAAGPEDR